MLSSLSPREVETTGTLDSATFSIKATGKAFKILIDGLYSDKVGAVIREISTNAYDAHIAAGHPEREFDMHLPTTYEPWFSVRDYGISMSKHQVMHLYTTVFDSTKDQSNDQVGALGLGSKSPFAYTDTFTVTAWHEGVCRVYSAFIGGDHVPRIELLSEAFSTEERGIEVSFPVTPSDNWEFRNKAANLLHGFPVLPNQTGEQITVNRPEVVQEGTNWKWMRGRSNSVARQGCVLYPIQSSAVKGANQAQIDLMDNCFEFNFPIGSLEIAANREALGYDARTSANILHAVDTCFTELIATMSAQVNACHTLWDAYITFNTLSAFGYGSEMRKLITQHVTWRGRNIYTSQSVGAAIGAAHGEVTVTYVSHSDVKKVRPFKWEPTTRVSLTPGDVIIFLDDKTKFTSMVAARIKHYLHTKNICKDVLWIKADPKSGGFKRFLVKLGRPAVLAVDALEKPPVEARGYSRSVVKMRKLGRYSSLEETTINEEAGGVYFDLLRGEPVYPKATDQTTSTQHVQYVREMLVRFGALQDSDEIIGVPATHKRMPHRNDGWVSIWDLARAFLAANPVDAQNAADHEAARDFMDENNSRITLWSDLVKMEQTPKLVGMAANECATVQRALRAVEEYQRDADLRRLNNAVQANPLPLPTAIFNYALMKDEIFNAVYPMIGLIFGNRDSNLNCDAELAILQYVNMIDCENERALTGVTLNDIAA